LDLTGAPYAYADGDPVDLSDPAGDLPGWGLEIGASGPEGCLEANSFGRSLLGAASEPGDELAPDWTGQGGGGGAGAWERPSPNEVIEQDEASALPTPAKVVNTNVEHAVDQLQERFPDEGRTRAQARNLLTALSRSIKANGFPEGSFVDPSNPTRILVPGPVNNALTVYQIRPNGNAVIKTVLIAR
jgi:hypothetical protein